MSIRTQIEIWIRCSFFLYTVVPRSCTTPYCAIFAATPFWICSKKNLRYAIFFKKIRLKLLANFHNFWPLSPSRWQIWQIFDPSKNADVLTGWFLKYLFSKRMRSIFFPFQFTVNSVTNTNVAWKLIIIELEATFFGNKKIQCVS